MLSSWTCSARPRTYISLYKLTPNSWTQTYTIKSTIAYYEHNKLPIIIPALDIGQPYGELATCDGSRQ